MLPGKGACMNHNILFFLTPKAMCVYLHDDYTLRQALEKMESAGYAALPILNKWGEYRGTLTEGDLLWAIKNMCYMDIRQAEAHRIMEISRRRDKILCGSTPPCRTWSIGPAPRILFPWWMIRTPLLASSPGAPLSSIAPSSCFPKIDPYRGRHPTGVPAFFL